jgi:chromosome segregation ATPase
MSQEFDKTVETGNDEPKRHTRTVAALIAGLAIALIANVYLLVRSNQLDTQMGQMRDTTQTQISKLGDATTSLLEQRLQEVNKQIDTQIKGTQDATATALTMARSESRRRGDEIGAKLEEQRKQVADDIAHLQDATTTADSKISEVSTHVDSVKTDVSGVKADVASTQSDLEKTGADLKRVMGDMGVMSGLIATNAKDLAALRELGDRNYIEFDLAKGKGEQKLAGMVLTLKKSDPKRNRYTVEVLAEDKRVEKRDKTINEPIQVYVGGDRQPNEIVVNQVKKDEVVGYVAIPKVTVARR